MQEVVLPSADDLVSIKNYTLQSPPPDNFVEDKGYFAVHNIDCRHFALHASMRSTEYKMTVALKLLIIIHNDPNAWTINQSKRLLGFRVVPSLNGISGSLIQTVTA